MTIRLSSFLVAALALAACSSTPPDPGAAANARASWRGASYDEMVKAWGQPRTAVNDGTNYTYTWVSEEPPSGGTSGFGVGVGRSGSRGGVGVGFGFPMGSPAPVAGARCDRTVVFRDGRVVDESWNGPDEYCQNFRKP